LFGQTRQIYCIVVPHVQNALYFGENYAHFNAL